MEDPGWLPAIDKEEAKPETVAADVAQEEARPSAPWKLFMPTNPLMVPCWGGALNANVFRLGGGGGGGGGVNLDGSYLV